MEIGVPGATAVPPGIVTTVAVSTGGIRVARIPLPFTLVWECDLKVFIGWKKGRKWKFG